MVQNQSRSDLGEANTNCTCTRNDILEILYFISATQEESQLISSYKAHLSPQASQHFEIQGAKKCNSRSDIMTHGALLAAVTALALLPHARTQCTPTFGKRASVVTIAGVGEQLLGVPTDLAFHPSQDNELWVASADRTDTRFSGNLIIRCVFFSHSLL